ncbi:MAG TPA: hypothetical protein DGT23_34160, partial [Micromonosporaceae bacterium]|nr:hypothetical protein [Micromonosporaceae bacterium]
MTEPNRHLVIQLLGPLAVSVDGTSVQLRPRRLRTLAVVLAMSAGRSVSVDQLAYALWDGELPEDVRSSVQNHVWRLRNLLGAEVIGTSSAGYQLRMDADDVDALRFSRLLDAALETSNEAAERELLTAALGLWRGNPFEDVPSEWLEQFEAPRLVERYLTAVERSADLRQAENSGRSDVVPQLRQLAARHPLRESLWRRLLVALDKDGRPAEALDLYETIRTRIAEELGVDPGQELQEVYADLLARTTQDFAHGAVSASFPVLPRQLPADIDGFAGREAALSALDGLLGDADDPDGRPVVITAIGGTAGVGKTSLAVHWAHRVAHRFPDGHLYVNLRGYDQSGQVATATEAVRGFLDALHMPTSQIPATLDAQVGLYRSLLAGKRILVVLDNARDSEQVRPLLPGAPGCLAVVTSRDPLISLLAAEGAHPIALDLLSADDSRLLLARRLGVERVAAEPRAVDDIIVACARLPLALAILAARASTQSTFPLTQLAAELNSSRGPLDALSGGDAVTNVRSVFSWSYRTLSPEAARLFRLLGLNPGSEFAAPAAASVAGIPLSQIGLALAELTRARMVTEHAYGRYGLHDLLRAYATELAHDIDTSKERHAATRRILDHYLQTAYVACLLISPHRETRISPELPASGARPQEVADYAEAMTWFTFEHSALVATVEHAAATGFETHAWQLAWALAPYLDRRGHWNDQVTTAQTALQAAVRLNSVAGQAHAHRGLGNAYYRLGPIEMAKTHLERAIDLFQALDDITGQASAHHGLAGAYARSGEYRLALRQVRRAHELFRIADDRAGQGRTLNSIGWYEALCGNYQEALSSCKQALSLMQEVGDRHVEAATWDSLGYTNLQLNESQEAILCYRQSLALMREVNDPYYEATVLDHLADAHRANGDIDHARSVWQRSLVILDQLHHPDADSVRTKLE